MALKRYVVTDARGNEYTCQLSDADAAAYGDAARPVGDTKPGPAGATVPGKARTPRNKARTPRTADSGDEER